MVRRVRVIVTLGGSGDSRRRGRRAAVRVVVAPALVDAGRRAGSHILARCPSARSDLRRATVIAEGRDTEIVAYGPDRVLRRPKRPRSLDGRGRGHGAGSLDHGYPCPRVFEVVPDGLVMERIDGVSMLDDLVSHPWRLRGHAATLAELHDRLHQLDAPDGLPEPFGPGRALVHGDLHPGNVMLTLDGPLVIDWTNAARRARRAPTWRSRGC